MLSRVEPFKQLWHRVIRGTILGNNFEIHRSASEERFFEVFFSILALRLVAILFGEAERD